MGQHQHDIDELARMERLCRDLAEESRVPGEAGALLKLAENYGREATKRTVVWTVDCSQRKRKRLAISVRLTRHFFRQKINKITQLEYWSPAHKRTYNGLRQQVACLFVGGLSMLLVLAFVGLVALVVKVNSFGDSGTID